MLSCLFYCLILSYCTRADFVSPGYELCLFMVLGSLSFSLSFCLFMLGCSSVVHPRIIIISGIGRYRMNYCQGISMTLLVSHLCQPQLSYGPHPIQYSLRTSSMASFSSAIHNLNGYIYNRNHLSRDTHLYYYFLCLHRLSWLLIYMGSPAHMAGMIDLFIFILINLRCHC